MRIKDFLNMVNGKLLYETNYNDTRMDINLMWLSHFFACNMLASGNMKKGMTPEKIRKNYLYMTEDEREKETQPKVHKVDREKLEAEKEALRKQFNLD